MVHFILLISVLLSFNALGASPMFETTPAFPVAPGNKPNYRIPAIVQAPDGDVLIIAERRNDGIGDIGDHDIVMKRSRDRGKTWGAEQMIFDDGTGTSTDITIGIDRTSGKLWLFFLRNKKQFDYFTSGDCGATWTAGKTIWPHPASYSDIVVLDDMTVGFVYERGDKGSTHYWDEIHFARFNLEWLTDGHDSLNPHHE